MMISERWISRQKWPIWNDQTNHANGILQSELPSEDHFEVEKGQKSDQFPTVINSFSTIEGDIKLSTNLRIDGKINGLVESAKNIVIGLDGYVKGVLKARNLISFGKIEGTVIVSGTAVFHPDSILAGELFTKDFNVYQGATISADIVTQDVANHIRSANPVKNF